MKKWDSFNKHSYISYNFYNLSAISVNVCAKAVISSMLDVISWVAAACS
jgi:hypothetical protein